MLQGHGKSCPSAARDRSSRARSLDSQEEVDGVDVTSSGFPSRSVSATRVRGTSVPAPNSPSARRAGADLRPFCLRESGSGSTQAEQAQYFNMDTPYSRLLRVRCPKSCLQTHLTTPIGREKVLPYFFEAPLWPRLP